MAEIVVTQRQVVACGSERRVLAPGRYTVTEEEAEAYCRYSAGTIVRASGAAGREAVEPIEGDGSAAEAAPDRRRTKPGRVVRKG